MNSIEIRFHLKKPHPFYKDMKIVLMTTHKCCFVMKVGELSEAITWPEIMG